MKRKIRRLQCPGSLSKDNQVRREQGTERTTAGRPAEEVPSVPGKNILHFPLIRSSSRVAGSEQKEWEGTI